MGFTFLLNKSLEDEKGIPKKEKKKKKGELCTWWWWWWWWWWWEKVLFQKGTEEWNYFHPTSTVTSIFRITQTKTKSIEHLITYWVPTGAPNAIAPKAFTRAPTE
jgi:hypothetical protein